MEKACERYFSDVLSHQELAVKNDTEDVTVGTHLTPSGLRMLPIIFYLPQPKWQQVLHSVYILLIFDCSILKSVNIGIKFDQVL